MTLRACLFLIICIASYPRVRRLEYPKSLARFHHRASRRIEVGTVEESAGLSREAYFANGELALARRAFTRALEVRRRIKHPGAPETKRRLARV